ncbi:MAG: DMT family transporter [Rhodospirillales bacterium]
MATPTSQSDPSRPEPDASGEGQVGQGVLWMTVAMACFVTMDTMAKHLVQTHSVVQVVWGRYFFQVVILAVILAPQLRRLMVTANLRLQMIRSLLLLVTTALYFSGLKFVPLAEASAIMMLTPLVVTALSVPLLREKVGPRRWAGVVIGFAGAMVIIRPGGDAMQMAALLPLFAALAHGFYQVSTRFLSHSESVLTTLCYSALLGALIMSAAVPFHWTPLPPEGWLLLAAAGGFGTIGHFALIKAFTLAPAATVAPFTYTNLIWAATYGLLIFGEWPDGWTIAGATVIAGSGIYIYHREKVLKSKAAS